MTTYITTAAPDGAAVTIDADRGDTEPQACPRIPFLVSGHNSLSPHRFVHKLSAPCAADTATQLCVAVKHYERHVLAWYALGRSADARAARDDIERRRRAIDALTSAQVQRQPIRSASDTMIPSGPRT
jgi:hypothetical protein